MEAIGRSPVEVSALGVAKITTCQGSIDASGELVFATALYLLLESRQATPRRLLQNLLWPEAPETTAGHRLRQTLFKLRRLGLPIESSGRLGIRVVAPVSIDYESLSAGAPVDTDARLGLPIFAGFEPRFSWSYAEWFEGRKARIAAHLTRVLLATVGRARLAGNWPVVEGLSQSLLSYSPDNEEATLALAEALAMRGDKIKGVKILDNYLADVGQRPSDLRLSATLMRRRIADRMPPRDHDVASETPLVGRAWHLERLANLLTRARSNRTETVVVWGAPGIGKSRLLTEFLAFSALQGAAWHRVSCRSTDSGRPLAVLLELIPLLRSMRGAIGSSPQTLAFFDTLTRHTPKDLRTRRRAHETEFASAGLDVAIADMVGAVTEEAPLVVAIEDCQWMDAASATVLTRLVQRLTTDRLLLIFTTRVLRDGPLSGLQFEVQDIELSALNEEASIEILHAIIRQKGSQVSSSYIDWCVRVAEGNPFFLHELANHWLETGEAHAAPPSLTAVLRQRLSRITPNSLQLLQTCALLENHSTLDNLEAVLGYPAHVLMHSINELALAGMVSLDTHDLHSPSGGRLNSRHDLLSNVALMQLAPAARTYLHRRAAKVIESSIEERGDASMLWSCAKHWQLAGDVSQAFRLATSCATHLLEAGLPCEAADAFEKAIGYCGTETDLLSVLQGQATAYYRSSDWQNVMGTVAKARALKQRLSPTRSRHDELELMERRAEWQTLNWNGILAHSLDCLNASEATAAHRVEAGSMALMMLSFQGDGVSAERVFAEIVSLASDPEVQAASALQATMIYHTNWGSLDKAVEAALALVAQNRSGEDVGVLFRSLCNAAVSFRAAGLFTDARQHLREALELAERHHLQLSKSRALPMLANLSLELGDIADAKEWLTQLQQCAIGTEDTLGRAEVSTISARIALFEGRYRDAEKFIERDLNQMRNDQVPHRRVYAAALQVAVEVANNGRASPKDLSELEAEYLRSRKNVFQAFATYSLYVGLLSVGESMKAKRLLREYVRTYRREPWPVPEQFSSSMMSLLDDAKAGAKS